MKSLMDITEEITKRERPGLWEKCYPRMYSELGNFYSPKIAAASLANAVMSAEENGLHGSTGIRNQFMVACACDEHKVPTFFVTKELLTACANTELPAGMTWTDIPMPHPGMVFMFERGALNFPDNAGPVSFLAIARFQSGQSLKHSMFPQMANYHVPIGAFVMLTAAHGHPAFYQYDLSMSENSPLIDQIVNAEEYRTDEILSSQMSLNESQFNQWLTRLAYKIILVMNARPEQLTAGSYIKSVKGKRPGEPKREFWTPNILGAHYRTRGESGGEHSAETAKRMHWRRGHFARQPHGPNMSLRKIIWREPVLVGELIA